MQDAIKNPDLSKLADNWPSPFVARQSIRDFSGGILTSRSLANLDSQGQGPAGRFRVGRKIAYPVESLISWMEKRARKV